MFSIFFLCNKRFVKLVFLIYLFYIRFGIFIDLGINLEKVLFFISKNRLDEKVEVIKCEVIFVIYMYVGYNGGFNKGVIYCFKGCWEEVREGL